ncbi:MAG: hypothetical protein HY553_14580 [Elusimicrobia bacterium]|nr:hypothetical protein [Elusimicrobiota bacterium]
MATALGGKLSRALTRLAFDQPFFGTLVAMTPLIEDAGAATLATNGERIYYNPAFLERLADAEVLGVLVHELMHIVYLHCDPARRGERDPCGWNAAGDFAINQELRDWGFSLPESALHDPRYGGLTTEAIYDRLPKKGACRCLDRLLPMPSGAREAAQGRILAAADASLGSVPREVARWLGVVRASRVPWRRLLHAFLREALARDEQSFLPPNRRHLWDGRYLPSSVAGRRGNLAVAVDTSGSIDDAQLASFAAELAGIAELCDELLVLTCDAAVHECVPLRRFVSVLRQLKFTGGGGTDFRPVFGRLARRRPTPDALLYLTDGEGKYPETAPRAYPVLWCLTRPAPVPWGRTLLLGRHG